MFLSQRHLLPSLVFCLSTHALSAEEAAPTTPTPTPSPWTHKLDLGAYLSSFTTGNSDTSRDSTIAGSNDSITYVMKANGMLNWTEDKHSVKQTLAAEFGQQKTEDASWVENIDLIDYDGAYDYSWEKPHFGYVAWGLDTVFTGAEPDDNFADPLAGKVSVGYGQRHWELKVDQQELIARAGIRTQKKWGTGLSSTEKEAETGWELFAHYDRAISDDISFWGQAEIFGEFEDAGHISTLLTAAVKVQLHNQISLDVSWRSYHETEPDDSASSVGYDEWSYSQSALIGITYTIK